MNFENFLNRLDESKGKPIGSCPDCGKPIYDDSNDVCCGKNLHHGQCQNCGTNFLGDDPAACPECGYNPMQNAGNENAFYPED
jgi:rubrerythrin